MITIYVNDKPVQTQEDKTILEVLRKENIEVPTLCNVEGLSPTGACRLCVVKVEGMDNLVPSCSYPVYEGMKVQTHSTEIIEARKTLIELLLADHPDDCLYCTKNASCYLKDLAAKYDVTGRNYGYTEKRRYMDISSPSITREPAKCILCGKCVRVCEEIQGIAAIDFYNRGSKTSIETALKQDLNLSKCINCGQCVNVCPTGALTETFSLRNVIAKLKDKNCHITIQHAPSVSVSIGEEFGLDVDEDIEGKLIGALRLLGFDAIFDTSFSADLTIMEESNELLERIKNNGRLPLITSCCPGWVKLMEQEFFDFKSNVSTCKSPQQMLGSLIKSFYAKKKSLKVEKIYNVAVMPCTAKKFEALRPELTNENGIVDIDEVITTRELAKLIGIFGLDLKTIKPELPDNPFGERSSAGKLFGVSGGVCEAALRNVYYALTNKKESPKVKELRGMEGTKEISLEIGDIKLKAFAVSGIKNAKELLVKIRNKELKVDFIEIMACPGGCINGGGQPYGSGSALQQRMNKIYNIDENSKLKVSSENPEIQRIYKECLGKPLGSLSHKLLHTEYFERKVIE